MSSEIFRGNQLIKGNDVVQEYTKAEITEYAKCKKDCIYFIEKYIKIINLDEGLVPFKLYPYQKKMIRAMINNDRVCLLTGRQQGKSVSMAAFLLWFALFQNNKTIALLANKSATAREIFSRVTLMLENIPMFLQPGCRYLNKGSVEFSNQSKIVTAATSSSSIRGMSVDLLALDEFSFVENADEFFTSTYPVVASGKNSKVIITSTPNGLNLFHKIWMDGFEGRNDFVSLKFIWSDVPGRGKRWEKKTRATVSPEQFAQEFEGNFLGSSNTLISSNALIALTERTPVSVMDSGRLKLYNEAEEKHSYVMTVDTAHGRGLDASAFSVFDVTEYPFKQVATYNSNEVSPLQFPNIINHVGRLYNNAAVLIETNDIGGQVVNNMNYDLEYENIVSITAEKTRKSSLGIRTTTRVKSIGCSNMKDLLEGQKLIVCDPLTITELTGFVAKGSSYEADSGFHDDMVMTIVLFAWFTTTTEFTHIKTDFNLGRDLYGKQNRDFEEMLPLIYADDGLENKNAIVREDGESWIII